MASGTQQGNCFKVEWPRRRRARLRGVLLVLATASLLALAQQPPPGSPDKPLIDPVLSQPPDKNAQMQMQQQQVKKAGYEAANIERKRQIADDSSKILELATELKKEVDKTGKDTLSLSVIRKAEMIEKLAKGVREKMKLTVGGAS